MKWLFIYRRDLVVCYAFFFLVLYLFNSFKFDFYVDAERMIVASMVLKNKVWYDTSSLGKNCLYL